MYKIISLALIARIIVFLLLPDDIDNKWIIDGKLKTKNGKTYMDLTSFQVKMKAKRGSFDLENLFNGNKILGE